MVGYLKPNLKINADGSAAGYPRRQDPPQQPQRLTHPLCSNHLKIQMTKLYSLFAVFFVATNAMAATEPPIEILDSGVKIQKIKTTKGQSPKASDVVTVHYRGTLHNGTEFDSSYKRGEPATFPLSRVIPCWTQGVQKMNVGEKVKLFCPAKTAYGERGAAGVIPPNSDLNFEVELLGIR